MKKTLFWVLVVLGAAVLVIRLASLSLASFLGPGEKAGISIISNPPGAEVFIDGVFFGKTPYRNTELEGKAYTVELKSKNSKWQARFKLTGGTLTIASRDLAENLTQQTGEVLSLKPGEGATIISSLGDVDVEIDGKYFGKTPLLSKIEAGEHTFTLSKQGFLKRSTKAVIPEGFNLTLSVDLALAEEDIEISGKVGAKPQAVVKDTPTNFLRVRDKPSTFGVEIARVKPGDVLPILDEQGAWFKIQLPDGKEGYVSSTYIEKKP